MTEQAKRFVENLHAAMDETVTTEQDRQAAHQAGYEAGGDAGSWVIDGNTTTETAAAILAGYEEGDPEVMDMQPSPLSGEWAGESISELSDRYGVNLADDELADEFEAGYSEGYWDVVCKDAQYKVS